MGIYNEHSRKVWLTVVLLFIVVVMAGCAGIQPYDPPNHREEGTGKGPLHRFPGRVGDPGAEGTGDGR